MDGYTGFKTATSEELPDAVAVMDPFHVVRLAASNISAAQIVGDTLYLDLESVVDDPVLHRLANGVRRLRPAIDRALVRHAIECRQPIAAPSSSRRNSRCHG